MRDDLATRIPGSSSLQLACIVSSRDGDRVGVCQEGKEWVCERFGYVDSLVFDI